MGGSVCQDAQGNNCVADSSVEMLDSTLGTWQAFPVPLGAPSGFLQAATLDNQLSALQGGMTV